MRLLYGAIRLRQVHHLCWPILCYMAMRSAQNVLLVGPDGCGKSHAVRSLAALLGVPVLSLYITPQTEPAALVGSLVPKPGGKPEWRDGAVSQAAREGCWLVLENFSEAQAAVLERLNPVLEQPPVVSCSHDCELSRLPCPVCFP